MSLFILQLLQVGGDDSIQLGGCLCLLRYSGHFVNLEE